MNAKNWLSIFSIILVGIVLGFFILRLEPAAVSTGGSSCSAYQ